MGRVRSTQLLRCNPEASPASAARSGFLPGEDLQSLGQEGERPSALEQSREPGSLQMAELLPLARELSHGSDRVDDREKVGATLRAFLVPPDTQRTVRQA